MESPLSAEGQAQAELVARSFGGQRLDAVYSSPLERAHNLARQVAEAVDAPLTVDERLTEIGQMPWEGLNLDEIRQRYPALYDQWYTEPDRVVFPGGEGLHQVQQRALSALQTIYSRWPDGVVAVVTHSVVIQTLVAAALCLDLRCVHRLRLSNCGVTTLCGTEAPGSLLTLNSTDAIYGSAVASAAVQHCVTWEPRRVTQ